MKASCVQARGCGRRKAQALDQDVGFASSSATETCLPLGKLLSLSEPLFLFLRKTLVLVSWAAMTQYHKLGA